MVRPCQSGGLRYGCVTMEHFAVRVSRWVLHLFRAERGHFTSLVTRDRTSPCSRTVEHYFSLVQQDVPKGPKAYTLSLSFQDTFFLIFWWCSVSVLKFWLPFLPLLLWNSGGRLKTSLIHLFTRDCDWDLYPFSKTSP